jgi:hypothetical protein
VSYQYADLQDRTIDWLLNGEDWKRALKVCENATLIQILCYWTLSISCFYLKHVSETGLYLCLQIKPTQLGPTDRAGPYLGTYFQQFWTKFRQIDHCFFPHTIVKLCSFQCRKWVFLCHKLASLVTQFVKLCTKVWMFHRNVMLENYTCSIRAILLQKWAILFKLWSKLMDSFLRRISLCTDMSMNTYLFVL